MSNALNQNKFATNKFNRTMSLNDYTDNGELKSDDDKKKMPNIKLRK